MFGSDHTVVHRPILESPAEAAVALLLGAAAAALGGLWLTGQLAGLLFGFAWPDVGLGDVFSVAARLPRHLDDPQRAWPVHTQSDLPGPIGFYTAAALAFAASTAAGTGLTRLWTRTRRSRGWASRAQLSRSLTPKAAIRRAAHLRPGLDDKPAAADVSVDLGRAVHTGQRLAVPIDCSVLLLAAPRAGKTSQVIIPWLADWPGPALVTSVRRDVADNTYQIRQKRGPAAVLDLTDTAWPDRLSWSPLSGCESFDKARERADVMVTVGKTETSDSTNAGFFGLTSTNLLAGWLHAAAINALTMEAVLKWALDETDNEPVRLLRDNPAAAESVGALLDNIYASPADTRSNMWTTALTGVAPLLSESARRTFCPPPRRGFDIEKFLRESGTIYLHVSEHQAADLAPLISAFVDEITIVAKRLGDAAPSGRLDPPLGMILDEVANVAPLPNLPALTSYAAGSGIFVVAVLQHVAGARDRWGREGAEMLWSSATLKMALGGLSGDELDRFSALSGDYRERLTSPQYGRHGAHMSTQLQDRKTLRPEDIRTLSTHRREALVVYSATPAVKTRLRRHYESDRRADYAASAAHMRDLTAAGDTTAPKPWPPHDIGGVAW
ncbi:MAG: type IV secretory system conjugative DNA transfer family protein [Stackebrandtia sp.]